MKQFTQPMLNIKLWGIIALVIGVLAIGAMLAVTITSEPGGDLRWFLGIILPIAVILQFTLLAILLMPSSSAMMKIIARMRPEEEVSEGEASGFTVRLIIAMGLGIGGVFLTMIALAMGTDLLAGGIGGMALFIVLFFALAAVEFWCILRPLMALQKKFGTPGKSSA